MRTYRPPCNVGIVLKALKSGEIEAQFSSINVFNISSKAQYGFCQMHALREFLI